MMDVSPNGLHDRLGSLSKGEASPIKREKEECTVKPVEVCDNQVPDKLVQRCVIIQRDEKGYGLTVSGDNPVFVQSVKQDGAAARAGVKQGDRIIKVNGTLVTQSNHQEVVQLIKSGSYVALTLLGKAERRCKTLTVVQPPFITSGVILASQSGNSGRLSSSSERITGPQPVDPEKQQQLTNARIHTIRKMYDKEVVFLENLQSEYKASNTELLKQQVERAEKRVKTLEEQLFNLLASNPDYSAPRSPLSPPMIRHTQSESSKSGCASQHHGKVLTHQTSAPILPKSSDLQMPAMEHFTASLPPTAHSLNSAFAKPWALSSKQLSSSTSLENLHINSKTTTWPNVGATHSRQSSSPDYLLYNIQHLQSKKEDKELVPIECSLSRSHSELGPKLRGRKASASDSEATKRRKPTYLSFRVSPTNKNEANARINTGSPYATPPTTPPPDMLAVENLDSADAIDDSEKDPNAKQDLSERRMSDAIEVHSPHAKNFNFDGKSDERFSPSNTGLPSQQDGNHSENQSSPTGSVNMQNIGSKHGQNPFIMAMEDDEMSSDTEMSHSDEHGPFNNVWKLIRNQAHLGVFLYFLIINGDPSSLFFYIITNWYEQGTIKEMKKWAYEIHSTFLVPGAPLRLKDIEDILLNEIDDLLQHQKEEHLKNLFSKARKRAFEHLGLQLADFRSKRTIGLGSIYGPPDYQLDDAMNDKSKEIKIIEQLLVPVLEPLVEDLDNINDKSAALASALATVLKQFGVKSPQSLSLIDRCPTFVAKEKTRLKFLQKNKKVMFVQNHHFIPQHYYCVTYCNHCQLIIWGVGNQGYQCHNCEMNIHKSCVKVVEETCFGALRNKKDKKRMSGLMENFIGKTRKPSHPHPNAIERAKRLNEDGSESMTNLAIDPSSETGITDNLPPGMRARLESGIDETIKIPNNQELSEKYLSKKGSSIGRSESFRQRRESKPSFRKRSDPNIPRSKSDVDVDDRTNLNNSGSSSNSSLSTRSLDSPSNSQEMVHRTPSGTPSDTITNTTVTSNISTCQLHQFDDSDLEAETDPPNWQENVQWEVLRILKPKEKKRQDVINELFHTERTHVRNLKLLDRLFHKPLQQEQLLPPDQLQLLFPNLEEMLEIHGGFNSLMKARRKEEPVIGDIGEMMLQLLDGSSGDHLKRAAATFCRNQTIALENLKTRQRKDQKLSTFLSEAEANYMCRRLQLKDIIATGFQRLTKYHLLLENVAKYTLSNSEEHSNLQRAVESSKQILAHVNQSVKEAENEHRLAELQRKLDRSSFEKSDNPMTQSFKNLDLTKHRLLFEGPLTWKLGRQKSIEIHVVLLEDILLLLQKQDDKFVLKFQNSNILIGKDDSKGHHMYSPILRVKNLFTRNVATDKKGFFLVTTFDQQAMYEFSAASPPERKIWLKHITDAVELYKSRNVEAKQKVTSIHSDRMESADENHEDAVLKMKENSQQENPVDVIEDHDHTSGDEISEPSAPSQDIIVEPTAPPQSPERESPVPSPIKEQEQEQEQKPQRRLQKVEILKIADGPQLIEPYEVIVNPVAVCQTAEPVLTPLEQLRRKDEQILSALLEKEEIVSRMLEVPKGEMEHITEITDESDGEKDANELVLAAINQANCLVKLLQENINVSEDEAFSGAVHVCVDVEGNRNAAAGNASPKVTRKLDHLPVAVSSVLRNISSSLNRHLNQLLTIVTDREEERKQMRAELRRSNDLIYMLHQDRHCNRHCHCLMHCDHCNIRPQSPFIQSRPNSFISVGSSTSECLENVQPEEQSDAQPQKMDTGDHQESANVEGEIKVTPVCVFQNDKQESFIGDETCGNNNTGEIFVDTPMFEPSQIPTNYPTTDLDCETELATDSRCSLPSQQATTLSESSSAKVENSEAPSDSNASAKTVESSEHLKTDQAVDPVYF